MVFFSQPGPWIGILDRIMQRHLPVDTYVPGHGRVAETQGRGGRGSPVKPAIAIRQGSEETTQVRLRPAAPTKGCVSPLLLQLPLSAESVRTSFATR